MGCYSRVVRRKESFVPRVVALVLFIALLPALAAACDDGGGGDAATVPATPPTSAASGTPAAGTQAAGTQTAGAQTAAASGFRSPEATAPVRTAPAIDPGTRESFNGGGATASVTVAGETYDYEGGACRIGADDEYVAVNIGTIGGGQYFAVLAGRSPAADADTRSTKGGGEFSGDDVLVTFVADGRSFLLQSADTKLTLAPDLRSGTFTSIEANAGADVRGEFACG
jgi:hypothetical protein